MQKYGSSSSRVYCTLDQRNLYQRLGKLAIRDMNNWAIEDLLLVDLAKIQCKSDDEGLYFCIKVDQHR